MALAEGGAYGKKPHLSMADVDSLTFEDGCLFTIFAVDVHEAPTPLAPLADTHGRGSLEDHDAALSLARAALAGVRLLVCPIDPAFAHEFPDTWKILKLWAWFAQTIAKTRNISHALQSAVSCSQRLQVHTRMFRSFLKMFSSLRVHRLFGGGF